MAIDEGQVIIEPATNRSTPQSQPVEALSNLDPQLDDNQVRQAIANAEANNLDPQSLTLDDLAKGPITPPAPPPQAPHPQPQPAAKETQVPQKFLKPDGAVDVDKIIASTQALEAAIQTKETAVNKTVEDYMARYSEQEAKFRNMPNPERLVKTLPNPPVQPQPEQANQNFEEVVRRDWQQDPLMTTTRLIDLALQQRFQPIEARERTESVRSNLQNLVAKDPRVLREDVYSAMTAKLAADPDLWKLKNPYRAVWLEVKEEMRLGDPSPGQAQPSRPLSPVLSGGSPPSAPSSSTPTPQNVVANLGSLDLRDKKQEEMGDAAIREMLRRG